MSIKNFESELDIKVVARALLESAMDFQEKLNDPDYTDGLGLCFHLSYRYVSEYELHTSVKNLMKCTYDTWQYYSGNIFFPVPSGVDIVHATDAYYEFPLYEGAYGEYRKDLLQHIINTCNELLK